MEKTDKGKWWALYLCMTELAWNVLCSWKLPFPENWWKTLGLWPCCIGDTLFERIWMRKSKNSICNHLRVMARDWEQAPCEWWLWGSTLSLQTLEVPSYTTGVPTMTRALVVLGRHCFSLLFRWLTSTLTLTSFNANLYSWKYLQHLGLI